MTYSKNYNRTNQQISIVVLMLVCYAYANALPNDSKKRWNVQLLYNNEPVYLAVIPITNQKKLSLRFDREKYQSSTLSYDFILCDKNWQEVNEPTVNYMKVEGFLDLTNYIPSLTKYTQYVHYKKELLQNAEILRSGNYKLTIYQNGNPNQRIHEEKVVFSETQLQPSIAVDDSRWSDALSSSGMHQITVTITMQNESSATYINAESNLSIFVIQNGSWARSFFMENNPISKAFRSYTYGHMGNVLMPSMGNYRLLSTANQYMNTSRTSNARLIGNDLHFNVEKDMPYFIAGSDAHQKLPGHSIIATATSTFDPHIAAEYAWVHFSFEAPKTEKPIYVLGAFNQYQINATSQMNYNEPLKQYEASIWVKQGHHQYTFVTPDELYRYSAYQSQSRDDNQAPHIYTALIYLTIPESRAEKVIGYTSIKTK